MKNVADRRMFREINKSRDQARVSQTKIKGAGHKGA